MILRILVMARTNDMEIPDKGKGDPEAGRWRKGEPVDVYEAKDGLLAPCADPAFSVVYVTDWEGTLQEAKDALLEPHYLALPTAEPTLAARRAFVLLADPDLDKAGVKVMAWADLAGNMAKREAGLRAVGVTKLAEVMTAARIAEPR